MRKVFDHLIRWGLGLHGLFHLIEFGLNIWEGAWASGLFTLFSGLLMISGAFVGRSGEVNGERFSKRSASSS